MQIIFNNNKESHTIGVELEFQVLDKASLNLTPRASEILECTSLKGLSKELFQSTIELVTPVCETIHDANEFFSFAIPLLRSEGEILGLSFAGTGTHPFADYRDRLITPSPRYLSLVSKNKWLIRRMAVYGMHVHIGMKSGEECIQYHNFFTRLIPNLISLSASSPFWQGMNTELAACRPTMYEALPTAGIPYPFKSWEGFQKLVDNLIKTESISSYKDLWWDIRPSPTFGTLEIRVCDGPATLSEMLAIASFIHAASFWFKDNHNEWDRIEPLNQWVIRENKWRAIRQGLDATIIVSSKGDTRLVRDDIDQWINKLEPYYSKLNYHNYLNDLFSILSFGNSSQRQIRVFQQANSIEEVVKHNSQEFILGKPIRVDQ
jgi:carboxylate-amine ligase